MKDKVMSEKTAKVLVVVSAIFLLLVGFGLYYLNIKVLIKILLVER